MLLSNLFLDVEGREGEKGGREKEEGSSAFS